MSMDNLEYRPHPKSSWEILSSFIVVEEQPAPSLKYLLLCSTEEINHTGVLAEVSLFSTFFNVSNQG